MTEADSGGDGAMPVSEPGAIETTGFGRSLAQAREAQGLSLAEIAARLRLHPRQIAALEAEQLQALPEAPFVRGFVRNYAKEVRLDPAPLLADLAAKLPTPAPIEGEAPAPAGNISAAEVRRAGIDRTSRAAVVGGAILVLVVLGLIGWIASTRTPVPAPEASQNAGVAVPGTAPAAAAPEGAAQEAADAPAAPAAGEQAVPAPSLAPSSAASPEPAAVPAPAPSPTAAAGGPVLRLVVGERPSWVEVTQGDGRVVLSGLLEAGSERRLGNPQPPLQLVIGNASSVKLEYRGKPVDLQRHVRGNDLARLSLE